jgi:hypothetical protein
VATRTDPERFFDHLIERVAGLARRIQDSVPAEGTAD